MEPDKKAESSRVVGYFCMGFALLMFGAYIYFLTKDQSDNSRYIALLLVPGIGLLWIGFACLSSGRRKSGSSDAE